MRYASVCDGIGAAHVAWQPLGWECAWTSEIDPFPTAVVEQRWGLPNLGDITGITDEQLQQHGPIDLLVGGTPCQSFSVAGLRKGLADPRGNLALVYLGLVERSRPQWVVWENVPGVLSSNDGRDFGAFLGALGQLGYGFAYRVLDAQYVRVQSHARAVPQRRRRVFVVGHFGDWRPAAAVLLERESMCGHPPPRRVAGQGLAGTLASRTTGGGYPGTDEACEGHVIPVVAQPSAVGNCLTRRMHKGINTTVDEGQTPVVVAGWDEVQITSKTNRSRVDPSLAMSTLAKQSTASVIVGTAVRRLTPRECERLQGFPDDYTLINYRGKPAADSPRYKALGNSMAVNVMSWIGQRIDQEVTDAE